MLSTMNLLLVTSIFVLNFGLVPAETQCELCDKELCEKTTSLITVCTCQIGKYDSCNFTHLEEVLVTTAKYGAKIRYPPNIYNKLHGYNIYIAEMNSGKQDRIYTISSNETEIHDLKPETDYVICFVPRSVNITTFRPNDNEDACVVIRTHKDYKSLYRNIAIAIATFLVVTVVVLLFIELCGQYLSYDQILFYNVPDNIDETPANTEAALFKILQTRLRFDDAREKIVFTKVERIGKITRKQPYRPISAQVSTSQETRLIMNAAAKRKDVTSTVKGNRVIFRVTSLV